MGRIGWEHTLIQVHLLRHTATRLAAEIMSRDGRRAVVDRIDDPEGGRGDVAVAAPLDRKGVRVVTRREFRERCDVVVKQLACADGNVCRDNLADALEDVWWVDDNVVVWDAGDSNDGLVRWIVVAEDGDAV